MAIYSGSASTDVRAGVIGCTINGEAIDVADDATYDCTTYHLDVLVGQSGFQGISVTPKVGTMNCTVRDAGNLSVQAINDLRGATVIFTCANGKLVTGTGMVEVSDGIEVNTKDGTFKVSFKGPSVVES